MDDWMAVVSLGFYPTPGVTASQRAHLAVSYGLLIDLPSPSAETLQPWKRTYAEQMRCVYNNYRLLYRRMM